VKKLRRFMPGLSHTVSAHQYSNPKRMNTAKNYVLSPTHGNDYLERVHGFLMNQMVRSVVFGACNRGLPD